MQTLVDTTIHTTISVADLPWEDIAACRAVPNAADLFFSEDIGDIAAAKRVCADCSVLAECLEAALDRASCSACGVGNSSSTARC